MESMKPDPYQLTSDLIANAIASARVFGENRRIANLVAGSVKRYMAETDDGEALLAYALGCIGAGEVGLVPLLQASLRGLSGSDF